MIIIVLLLGLIWGFLLSGQPFYPGFITGYISASILVVMTHLALKIKETLK